MHTDEFDSTCFTCIEGYLARRAPAAEAAQALHERLAALAGAILAGGERMNLTGDREPALFWQRHIADALGAAEAMEAAMGPPAAGARILDVGSGGGIPGLVWALIWPQGRVTLLEARRKRADFMTQTARELGLETVRVVAERAEDLGRTAARESYDLVTARALAPLPTLLELTLPFVRIGGWLGAIKSAPLAAELEAGRPALELLGGAEDVTLRPYTRADGKECVVYLARKARPTPAAYPRRPNLPERRPLGGGAPENS